MQSLTKSERIKAILLLSFFYLIGLIQDLYLREVYLDWRLLVSTITWLIGFYWLPFLVLIYVEEKLTFLTKKNIVIELIIYIGLMFIGINCVFFVLEIIFKGYKTELIQGVLSSVLWGIFIFTLYKSWMLYKKYQQEILLRKEAQLNALKNQLNPHFLFNSLNTISSFIHHNPNKADEVLLNLSDILRYSLDKGEVDNISLKEEVMITNAYLEIEKARFNENLIVTYDIDDNCLQSYVPPLMLQPLIENSIKHVTSLPIKIHIDASLNNNMLNIKIQDNGSGFSNDVLNYQYKSGHGLKITQGRIGLIDNAIMKLSNNNGACVEFSLEAVC